MSPRSLLSVVAISCLVLAACASQPPPDPLTAADLFRYCGNLRFEGPVDEDLVLNPVPDDVKQILDEELDRIGATEDLGTDTVQWYLVSRTEEVISVGFKRPNGDLDSYTQGHLRRTEEGWRGGGWGPCEVRFSAENRQTLRWSLEGDLGPGDSSVTVRATQIVCGSEPPLEASNIEPVIVPTSDRITILLTAPWPPQSDDLACFDNSQPYIIDVDLGEPVGRRELHDGGSLAIGSQRYPESASS